jgi:hypothetical protein
MIGTTDDRKVRDITLTKDLKDVEVLWILVFWEKKLVESFTKELALFS